MGDHINAVVFDIDNTLWDYRRMKKACVDAGLDKMIARGLPITKEEGDRIVEDVFINHTWEDQRLFWHVAEHAGVTNKVTIERFAQLGKTAYRLRQREFLTPYNGVPEALETCKRYVLDIAALSDAPRLKGFDRLCDLGLEPYFEDRVVGAEKYEERKPEKIAFRRVLKVLGRKTAEGVLMVGDHPNRDMGARKYGFLTAWAKYGYVPKPHEDVNTMNIRADYVLSNPADLAAVIQKFG